MKLSGYTFAANAKGKMLPYEACIKSLSVYCDEICVAYDPRFDNAEDFTTIDQKVIAIPCELDLRQIDGYGRLMTCARRECSGDWLIWMDLDEILHEKDVGIISDLIEYSERNDYNAIELSMYQFYTPRYTFPNSLPLWSIRPKITKNLKDVYHGVDVDAVIPCGDHFHLSSGDGCDWIKDEKVFAHHCLIYRDYGFLNKMQKNIAGCLDVIETTATFPYVYHYSRYNMQRKLKMNMYQREDLIQNRSEDYNPELWERNLAESIDLVPQVEIPGPSLLGPVEPSHPACIKNWISMIDQVTGGYKY